MSQNSYSFSVRRALVTFKIWQALLDTVVPMMARGLGLFRFDVRESDEETTIRAIVDPSLIVKLGKRLQPFIYLYAALVRATFLPTLRWMAKMHTVKLSDMAEGDVSLVFSKTGALPLVVVKS